MSLYPKKKESKKREEISENPLFQITAIREIDSTSFMAPGWFSDRHGPYLCKLPDALMNCPVYGIQIKHKFTNSFVWEEHNMLVGCSLFKPEPQVYSSKRNIPPWMLFNSSPWMEGEIVESKDEGVFLVIDGKELVRCITHYQKELRDPSLALLKDVLTGNSRLRCPLKFTSKSQKVYKMIPQKVDLKFNPWFREQLTTLERFD